MLQTIDILELLKTIVISITFSELVLGLTRFFCILLSNISTLQLLCLWHLSILVLGLGLIRPFNMGNLFYTTMTFLIHVCFTVLL